MNKVTILRINCTSYSILTENSLYRTTSFRIEYNALTLSVLSTALENVLHQNVSLPVFVKATILSLSDMYCTIHNFESSACYCYMVFIYMCFSRVFNRSDFQFVGWLTRVARTFMRTWTNSSIKISFSKYTKDRSNLIIKNLQYTITAKRKWKEIKPPKKKNS